VNFFLKKQVLFLVVFFVLFIANAQSYEAKYKMVYGTEQKKKYRIP